MTSTLIATGRLSAVQSGVPYIVSLTLIVPTSIFLNHLFPEYPLFKGQSPAIVFTFILFLVASMFWLLFKPWVRPSRGYLLFTALMLLGWAWFVYLAIRHDYGSNYTVWLTPFILLMFVIKPPDLKAVYWAVDVLIVSMLLISIISHLLHVLDIYPFPNFIYPQRLPQFIQEAGILPLLGLEYRWPGPFVSVSDAGPVGALLFSLGWLRHGLMRWIAIVGGVAILLAAFSFNGIFAALGGALVVFLFSQSPRLGSLSVYSRVSLASVALVGSLIFVTSTNSTLNGRTEIWIDYLRVWDRFPQFGTGPSYIVNRPEVFSHDHAHNFYIDTLIKHGWIAFLLAISALLCVGVLTVKATKLGIAGALGVWTTIMLLLVAETLIAWRYMGSYLFVLLLIAALSNGAAALTTRPDTVRN